MTHAQPHTDDHAESDALQHARRVLAASREGVLFIDERSVPIRFAVTNADGRLIASVPAAALLEANLTLMVPEDSEDALQLLLSPEQAEESAETDRWMAHHIRPGEEPEHVRWAVCWIDSAKHGPWVFDGEPLMTPNPAAAIEPKLCAQLNADRERLGAIVAARTGVEVEDPVCVAVDGFGLLVRARYGVVRVWFEDESRAPEEVLAALGDVMG